MGGRGALEVQWSAFVDEARMRIGSNRKVPTEFASVHSADEVLSRRDDEF